MGPAVEFKAAAPEVAKCHFHKSLRGVDNIECTHGILVFGMNACQTRACVFCRHITYTNER
jgi:hypothetical protein